MTSTDAAQFLRQPRAPSSPAGSAFSPFLPGGSWDKDPAGQVLLLWSRGAQQEGSLPLIPEIRQSEGGSPSPAPASALAF